MKQKKIDYKTVVYVAYAASSPRDEINMNHEKVYMRRETE